MNTQTTTNAPSLQHKSHVFFGTSASCSTTHCCTKTTHPLNQSQLCHQCACIAKLDQGQIRELCNKAFAFPELTPDWPANAITDNNEPSFHNATQFCPEAQAAANSDNLHTACQRMLSSLSKVKLHPRPIDRIKSTIFPPRFLNCTPCNTRQTPAPTPATPA
jgi:hypothetical protein